MLLIVDGGQFVRFVVNVSTVNFFSGGSFNCVEFLLNSVKMKSSLKSSPFSNKGMLMCHVLSISETCYGQYPYDAFII
jgi:hypothetical protein